MTGFKSKRQAARSRDMTPWFPVTIFPVRVGVYEVANHIQPNCFSKWDGKKWCLVNRSIAEAEIHNARSWAMLNSAGVKWRGFTHEQ